MDRHLSDEQLDRAIAGFLVERRGEIEATAMSSHQAASRVRGGEEPPLQRSPLRTRLLSMNTTLKLTAVAVFALAVGVTVLPRGADIGAAPAPSASPPPSPIPLPEEWGPLTAGTYVTTPFATPGNDACFDQDDCLDQSNDDAASITFSVPDGWQGSGTTGIFHESGPATDGAALIFVRGASLADDPCVSDGPPDIPVGPSVDDFVSALVDHPLLDVTEPVDVTLAGYPGTYLELQVPTDLTGCEVYRPWEPWYYAQDPGELWHLWILDANGLRVVIQAIDHEGTSPDVKAQLQAIVDTITIDHDPTLVPSPSPQAEDTASVVNGWPSTDPQGDPAGLYSWAPGRARFMHKVVAGSGSVEITFEELEDDADEIYVSDISGRTELDLEDPTSELPQRVGDVRFQFWTMSVAGDRIAIVVKSYADTAPAVVAEAEAVVESIYSEPMDTGAGYRLVFELLAGWDSG